MISFKGNKRNLITCGNSLLEIPDTWDDGNNADNDGCSSTCIIESGYECPNVGQEWLDICGDGIIVKR